MSNYNDTKTLDADYVCYYQTDKYSIAKLNAVITDYADDFKIYGDTFEDFSTNDTIYAKGNVPINF